MYNKSTKYVKGMFSTVQYAIRNKTIYQRRLSYSIDTVIN